MSVLPLQRIFLKHNVILLSRVELLTEKREVKAGSACEGRQERAEHKHVFCPFFLNFMVLPMGFVFVFVSDFLWVDKTFILPEKW